MIACPKSFLGIEASGLTECDIGSEFGIHARNTANSRSNRA